MGVITWVIFGAIAGWIASVAAGTNAEQGWLGNILVGICGALLGGFIFNLLGGVGVTGFNVWSLIVAVVGSFVLLTIIKIFRHPAHHS
jgi:uncharacterized membrane protein YeaQ/YmgE (transglycosylase-associated protein family)